MILLRGNFCHPEARRLLSSRAEWSGAEWSRGIWIIKYLVNKIPHNSVPSTLRPTLWIPMPNRSGWQLFRHPDFISPMSLRWLYDFTHFKTAPVASTSQIMLFVISITFSFVRLVSQIIVNLIAIDFFTDHSCL